MNKEIPIQAPRVSKGMCGVGHLSPPSRSGLGKLCSVILIVLNDT